MPPKFGRAWTAKPEPKKTEEGGNKMNTITKRKLARFYRKHRADVLDVLAAVFLASLLLRPVIDGILARL